MVKWPTLKAREVIKVLKRMGFFELRRRGSHIFFKHSDGRSTVVPYHSKEDIGKGLFRQILKDIEIEPEEFFKILKKKQ